MVADTFSVVMQLNRMITGWANYFCLGPVSHAYRAVDEHARNGLRQWLRKKHKVPGRGTAQFPDHYLHQGLGLIHLGPLTAHIPWAGT
jgi:RNA-directed DNA polymerase